MPPLARSTGHRLMPGTAVNAAAVTTSYVIQTTDGSGWSTTYGIATDQKAGGSTRPVIIPWLAPVASPDSVPQLSQYTTNLDGSMRGDGFYSVTWTFAYWTFSMHLLVLQQFFSSGAAYSAAVSLMTYDQNNVAVYLTATCDQPRAGVHMEPEVGGWKNVKLVFHDGAIIT